VKCVVHVVSFILFYRIHRSIRVAVLVFLFILRRRHVDISDLEITTAVFFTIIRILAAMPRADVVLLRRHYHFGLLHRARHVHENLLLPGVLRAGIVLVVLGQTLIV
jgi:hypothetical protein